MSDKVIVAFYHYDKLFDYKVDEGELSFDRYLFLRVKLNEWILTYYRNQNLL